VLGAIASKTSDPRDPDTFSNRDKVFTGYTQFVNPSGLQGARIGVARDGFTGASPKTDAIFEEAIQAAGAVVIDPADIPTIDQINSSPDEIIVFVFEFKRDLNAYLATRTG
jgi:amidase